MLSFLPVKRWVFWFGGGVQFQSKSPVCLQVCSRCSPSPNGDVMVQIKGCFFQQLWTAGTGRVFVLGDQTKLCAEPDPSRCVQSRWSSVSTSYVDAPVSVIPNWPIQMQLFITHFASVEKSSCVFHPCLETGSRLWVAEMFWRDPSSCDLSLSQLLFWHRQLLEGPVPTLGQMWALSEGGGCCKWELARGVMWTVGLWVWGQACEGPEWDEWLSVGLLPWQQCTREVFCKLVWSRRLIINPIQRPVMGDSSVSLEDVRAVSTLQNGTVMVWAQLGLGAPDHWELVKVWGEIRGDPGLCLCWEGWRCRSAFAPLFQLAKGPPGGSDSISRDWSRALTLVGGLLQAIAHWGVSYNQSSQHHSPLLPISCLWGAPQER